MAQRGMTEEEKEVCLMLLSRVGWGPEEVEHNDRKPSVYEKRYFTAGVGYN